MADEGVSGSAESVAAGVEHVARSSGRPISAPRVAPPPNAALDAAALLRRLAGKPANDVLSRISNGDPLRLYRLCARRIRDGWFVLDPDRVFEQALAMVAVGIEIEPEACVAPDWLARTLDRAIQATLDKDREDERAGEPDDAAEEHFRVFVDAFFVEPALARGSSVRFNGLEKRVRKGFFLLIVEGKPLEECFELDLGPPERLQADVVAALEAIGLFDDDAEAPPEDDG